MVLQALCLQALCLQALCLQALCPPPLGLQAVRQCDIWVLAWFSKLSINI